MVARALSAINIALWDIAGKRFGVPAWQLMGGRCRDRVRLYMHVGGGTPDELARDAAAAVDDGFTAVRFTPFPSNYPKDAGRRPDPGDA